MARFKVQYQFIGQRLSPQTSWTKKVLRFPLWFWSKVRTLFASLWSSTHRAWSGTKSEMPKTILRENFSAKLRKCLVHLPPVLTTIVLVSLSLVTFFIGGQYPGLDGSVWQSFDSLLLQVAAKIMELCVVASLATILLDILRRELLFSASGLPLGLLTAKTQFTDLTYIVSPQFRAGISGLPVGKRWVIGLMTVLFALMSVLAGPSSALLIIPQMHTDWEMGAATVYFNGTEDSVWPSSFNGDWTGTAGCYPVTANSLLGGLTSSDVCIWAGYSSILTYFSSYRDLLMGEDPMTMHDYTVLRETRVDVGWAHGVDLASAYAGLAMSIMWDEAMNFVYPVASYTASKFANVESRLRDSNIVTMSSNVPVVHTNCNLNESVTYSDMMDKASYPLQEFDDVTIRAQVQYNPKAGNTYANSSSIATIWFGSADLILSDNQQPAINVSEVSSAYLNVQIPGSVSGQGALVTCSIDARWVYANIKGTNGISLRTPIMFSAEFPKFMSAKKDLGRRVDLTTEWLYKLTPQVDDSTDYYTTLAVLLEEIGLHDTDDSDYAFNQVRMTIESVVSVMISDAMSRAVFTNWKHGIDNIPIPKDSSAPSMKAFFALLSGNYDAYLFDRSMSSTDVSTTTASWSTTVAGFGFRAATAPYYLAVSVLLLHALLAVCHVIWVFSQGETSTAWACLTDLVALAIQSPLPLDPILRNTSAGIEHHANYKERVRIQARLGPETPDGSSDSSVDLNNQQQQQSSTTTKGVEMILGFSSGVSSKLTEVVARQKY